MCHALCRVNGQTNPRDILAVWAIGGDFAGLGGAFRGAKDLDLARVEPDEHPTHCWAPVQGSRCCFDAKLAKSKQSKMSSPAMSVCSFVDGLSCILKRPT